MPAPVESYADSTHAAVIIWALVGVVILLCSILAGIVKITYDSISGWTRRMEEKMKQISDSTANLPETYLKIKIFDRHLETIQTLREDVAKVVELFRIHLVAHVDSKRADKDNL